MSYGEKMYKLIHSPYLVPERKEGKQGMRWRGGSTEVSEMHYCTQDEKMVSK